MSKENCEKIHNIMARVSEQYKVNIKPEPVKINQTPCPSYYEKYRIYPKTETDLLHNMVFNVCKNQQEISLNDCIIVIQESRYGDMLKRLYREILCITIY